MKKRLPLLLIPILFLVTACTKTTQVVTPNQTILVNVVSGNWSTTNGGKTYSTFINVPELSSYQHKYGATLVYATYDNGATYEQIPEVFGGIAYSFTHSSGQVEVDIQSSDGTSTITPPGAVGIKIVLIDSSL